MYEKKTGFNNDTMIPDLAKVISCYAICRERFELEGQINIVENIERISEIELKSLSENPSLRDYCFARYVLSFANLVSWFMDFIREEFPEARLGDVKEYEKAFAAITEFVVSGRHIPPKEEVE